MMNFTVFVFSISVLASYAFYAIKVQKELIDLCNYRNIQSSNKGLAFIPLYLHYINNG